MKKTLLIVLLLIVGFSNVNGQTYTGMEFYDNGKPKSIKTYKESKGKLELVKATVWYHNGQKKEERTYKDGKRDGLRTYWYENGQKEIEANYKDGKANGKYTRWGANGNKKEEGTYKDGKEIDSKKY